MNRPRIKNIMRFSNFEKKLLKQIIQLNNYKNILKLPTTTLFLQDVFFREHREMFLMIHKAKAILFFKADISQERKKELFFKFHKMFFLLVKLQKNDLINCILFPNDQQTYCMSPDCEIRDLISNGGIYQNTDMNGELCIKNNENSILFFGIILPQGINEQVCQLVISYMLVSETLIDFVKHNFKFPDEVISIRNLNAAWCGIWTAIAIGIVSIMIEVLKP